MQADVGIDDDADSGADADDDDSCWYTISEINRIYPGL